MTNPEALFGVVPFGRVDFGVDWQGKAWLGWACHGKESGAERHGVAWQGLAGRGMESGTARQGKAGLGAAWRGAAWHGIWQGYAGQGEAWHGMEYGRARPGMAGRGGARHGLGQGLARRGTAWRGAARRGKARNMGGHIRKNNKPTQPNGNNTLKRIDEPRRRFVFGLPKRSQRSSPRDEHYKLARFRLRPVKQGQRRMLDRGGQGRSEDGERCTG